MTELAWIPIDIRMIAEAFRTVALIAMGGLALLGSVDLLRRL
jgi:hypothetical protein